MSRTARRFLVSWCRQSPGRAPSRSRGRMLQGRLRHPRHYSLRQSAALVSEGRPLDMESRAGYYGTAGSAGLPRWTGRCSGNLGAGERIRTADLPLTRRNRAVVDRRWPSPDKPSACTDRRWASSCVGHRLPALAPLWLPASGDPAVSGLHMSGFADRSSNSLPFSRGGCHPCLADALSPVALRLRTRPAVPDTALVPGMPGVPRCR